MKTFVDMYNLIGEKQITEKWIGSSLIDIGHTDLDNGEHCLRIMASCGDSHSFLYGLDIDFWFSNDADSFIEVLKDCTAGNPCADVEIFRLPMTASITSLLDQLDRPALVFIFGVIIGLIASFAND